MSKITSAEALRKAIATLEQKQLNEGILLREQFFIAYESLKPVNVLRNLIRELLIPSPDLKENIIHSAIGLISGYLSRMLMVRSSKSPLLRFAGLVAQYGITNLVLNNSDAIKNGALRYIQKLTKAFAQGKT